MRGENGSELAARARNRFRQTVDEVINSFTDVDHGEVMRTSEPAPKPDAEAEAELQVREKTFHIRYVFTHRDQ